MVVIIIKGDNFSIESANVCLAAGAHSAAVPNCFCPFAVVRLVKSIFSAH